MNKIKALTVILACLLAACSDKPDIASNKMVTRVVKGSEIKIVAPDRFVPICESSLAIWGSVNKSVSDEIHLLSCFIKDFDKESAEEVTVEDMYPLMTVGIPKSMINRKMEETDFSAMIEKRYKPDSQPNTVVRSDEAFCFSGLEKSVVTVENDSKELEIIVVTCLALIEEKFLVLTLGNELKGENDFEATRQLARDWLELMQSKN